MCVYVGKGGGGLSSKDHEVAGLNLSADSNGAR